MGGQWPISVQTPHRTRCCTTIETPPTEQVNSSDEMRPSILLSSYINCGDPHTDDRRYLTTTRNNYCEQSHCHKYAMRNDDR